MNVVNNQMSTKDAVDQILDGKDVDNIGEIVVGCSWDDFAKAIGVPLLPRETTYRGMRVSADAAFPAVILKAY